MADSQPADSRQPAERARAAGFHRDLGLPDFTLLVIGAVVGDGIYVVGAMGARSLGPAQVVAWLVAGVLAALIGLAFVQCAAIDAEVGGSYAYARRAFGPFVGFLAGWALYFGEWVALSAFPTAFFNYFGALTGVPASWGLPVKLVLIVGVTLVNLGGVRQGARTNDVLTVAKLLPLILLIVLGGVFLVAHFHSATTQLQPFAPIGWSGFGAAILPIFWAYAGFELAVLPSAEVRDPARNLPLGLLLGMAIATTFYLLTSLAFVVGLPWQELAASTHPLSSVISAILASFGAPGAFGARFVSLGGMVSIAGVFIVFTLSLARLSYALALDGLVPRAFARLDNRHGTPYVGMLFQGASSFIGCTLFDLRSLLSTAVVFLSLCYLLTCLSALRLVQRQPEHALRLPGLRVLLVLGAGSSVYLIAQATTSEALVAGGVMAGGVLMFVLHGRHAALEGQAQPAVVVAQHPHAWLHSTLRRLAMLRRH